MLVHYVQRLIPPYDEIVVRHALCMLHYFTVQMHPTVEADPSSRRLTFGFTLCHASEQHQGADPEVRQWKA